MGSCPMDKRTYFLSAIKAQAHLNKDWIISVFSVAKIQNPDPADRYPFQLLGYNRGMVGTYIFFNPDPSATDIQGTVIEGSKGDEPIFNFRDELILKPGDLPNVTKNIKTTYGNALFNAIVLCWPFGGKIEFQEGAINGGKIDKMVAAKMVDTPPEGTERDPNNIYVDEFLNYMKAMSSLAGIAPICAPGASPKTMTIDPAVVKHRDQLFKDAGDTINDKAVLAKIEKELAEMDRQSFKGDESEDFFIKAKSFDVVRKRCFIDYGAESGFSESSKSVTIKKSLREGIDLKEMPTFVDTLRAGSYYRGAETALGGESVKYFYRVFQNTRVAEEDCGSKSGLVWFVTEDNKKKFVGRWLASSTGKPVLLTTENIDQYKGKVILVRSPMVCKTQTPSYCAVCVGKAYASMPTGLHIAASNVGSAFMSASMAAMHVKALRVTRFDFKTLIS